MNSAQLPLLAVAPSQRSRKRSSVTATVEALALASLCVATWPIEEMPHDDVAGFCLAAPRNYVSLGDLGDSLAPWR
jgi:hypothetical protein